MKIELLESDYLELYNYFQNLDYSKIKDYKKFKSLILKYITFNNIETLNHHITLVDLENMDLYSVGNFKIFMMRLNCASYSVHPFRDWHNETNYFSCNGENMYNLYNYIRYIIENQCEI